MLNGDLGFPELVASLMSYRRMADMTALDVSGAKISNGRKYGIPSYAQANVRLCTTDTVDVEGAMLDDTMHPLLRAVIALQCCMRFARA